MALNFVGGRKMNEEKEIKRCIGAVTSIMGKYNKRDVLTWLSASSILPGNEVHECRFRFLIKCALSLPKTENINGFDEEVLQRVFEETKQLDWKELENWIPIPNSKSNTVYVKNNYYNFLAGDIENPEEFIEDVFKRYGEFEKEFEGAYRYKPSEKIMSILEYQTALIKLIEVSDGLFFVKEGFTIPKNEFVERFKLCQQNSPTLPLTEKRQSSHTGVDLHLNQLVELTEKDNVFKTCSYLPSSLLLAFRYVVSEQMNKLNTANTEKRLNQQLLKEVLSSLLESVPHEAILSDYKISGTNQQFDFGFMVETGLFNFSIVKQPFDIKKVKGEFVRLFETYTKIQKKFKRGSKYITHQRNRIKLTDNTELFFIVVFDDLDAKTFTYFAKGSNVCILGRRQLQFIFEHLRDNGFSPSILARVIKNANKEKSAFFLSFIDFYLAGVHPQLPRPPFLDNSAFTIVMPGLGELIKRKNLKKRPKMDIRPKGKGKPFEFKVIKMSADIFKCYDSLTGEYFLYLDTPIKMYLFVDKKDLDEGDGSIVQFLLEYLGFYLPQAINKLKIEGSADELLIWLIPKTKAKDHGIKQKIDGPFAIGQTYNGFVILFDSMRFIDFYNADPKAFMEKSLLTITQNILNRGDKNALFEWLFQSDPTDKFKISVFELPGKIDPHIHYPTILDFSSIENELIGHLKEKVKQGKYQGDEAKKIVDITYKYLLNELKKKLANYQKESVIKFSLDELENIQSIRRKEAARLSSMVGLKTNYDPEEEFVELEKKLQEYAPACRYITELVVPMIKEGKRPITENEWRELSPYAIRILKLSTISDLLYGLDKGLKNIIDITVEVDFKINFFLRIETTGLERYFDYFTEGIKNSDFSHNLSETNNPEMGSVHEQITQLLEDGALEEISNNLEKDFGFRLSQFALTILTIIEITKKRGWGVYAYTRQELIEIVNRKIGINKNTLGKVLDFCTLYFEDKNTKDIEIWRVSSRKNRLTIKPLVPVNGKLYFSTEVLMLSNVMVVRSILDGKWPYNLKKHPDLKKALEKQQIKSSREFEKGVYKKIKRFSEYIERDIKYRQNKNNKCLVNVKEPCPGQIDALSVHIDKKKIVVWEAKHIRTRFGAREIITDIQDFIEPDTGYLPKIKRKQEYIKKHVRDILEYYGIDDSDKNWEVVGCIVTSYLSPGASILANKYPIIPYSHIEEFLTDLN